MKTLTQVACAAILAATALAPMTIDAQARSRHQRTTVPKSGMNNTGGRNASPSAVGGNAAQPSRPGAQGSGGGSGGAGSGQ